MKRITGSIYLSRNLTKERCCICFISKPTLLRQNLLIKHSWIIASKWFSNLKMRDTKLNLLKRKIKVTFILSPLNWKIFLMKFHGLKIMQNFVQSLLIYKIERLKMVSCSNCELIWLLIVHRIDYNNKNIILILTINSIELIYFILSRVWKRIIICLYLIFNRKWMDRFDVKNMFKKYLILFQLYIN